MIGDQMDRGAPRKRESKNLNESKRSLTGSFPVSVISDGDDHVSDDNVIVDDVSH